MMRKHRKNRKKVASITILIFLLILLLRLPPSTLSYSTNTDEVRADTTPPDPIENLTATDTGLGGRVNLTWNESKAVDFKEYRVYQNASIITNVSSMSNITTIDVKANTFYQVTGLTNGQTYYFAVTAVDQDNNENTTIEKSASATPTDITPPTLYIQEPANTTTIYGEITIRVKVDDYTYNIQYVNVTIDKTQVLSCTYIPFDKTWNCVWNTTTETNGEHTIDATATDNSGNTGSAEHIIVNVSNQYFTLCFNPGWNLITLPLDTIYKWAGDLANAVPNCTHIGEWNTSSQQFEFYVKNTGVNNFALQHGRGYMVYTNTSTSLMLTGTNITSATINLDAGWNSIGRINSTTTTAENLGQNIINCTAVAYWNVTLGRFIVHPINTEISDFAVERGCGYFVYVTNESIWTNQ
ncbi:MAG: fibronectin type III domain-containing protein [Thermoplasmatales archaeon]|nr:fibronectin type III domain-containing protein [Candidatus Thermoplasmatota archaeon]MCG2825037.1 fibronectin type III domain-containing protein [Thermoplasmatales archaeon]